MFEDEELFANAEDIRVAADASLYAYQETLYDIRNEYEYRVRDFKIGLERSIEELQNSESYVEAKANNDQEKLMKEFSQAIGGVNSTAVLSKIFSRATAETTKIASEAATNRVDEATQKSNVAISAMDSQSKLINRALRGQAGTDLSLGQKCGQPSWAWNKCAKVGLRNRCESFR